MRAAAPAEDAARVSTSPKLTGASELTAVIVVAVLVAAIAALRATMGVSLYDDSHYVVVALRLAQGARPFADEMTMQSLGFLPAAAFAWVWTHLFGLNGLVIAFRLFYVTLASAVAVLAYSQLSRSFRPIVAALAVTVPLLCPPFNLLAPGYNLMTTLGLLAATALAHHALIDRDWRAAAGAGLALVFASITYPPMAIASCVFVVVFAVLARDRRLTVAIVAAGAIAVAVFLACLFSFVTLADFRHALAYASANVIGFGSPRHKLKMEWQAISSSLSASALWPLWGVALLSSLPRIPKKLRAVLFLAIAPLSDLRGIQIIYYGGHKFGNTAPAWLITFTLGALLPVAVWAITSRRREVLTLFALTFPVSLVAFLTVLYSTDAGWMRAVPVIGLVPVAIAVLAGWGTALDELWGVGVVAIGALTAVVIAIGMLYATSLDDAPPVRMTAVMDHGAYAGMRMSPARLHDLLALEAAGRRWVRPNDRVTFYGERPGYLLVGGKIYTNAVWLYLSPSDQFTLDYFQQHGGLPDVVFTDEYGMQIRHQDYGLTSKSNPFVGVLLARYRLVQHVDNFGVWIKR